MSGENSRRSSKATDGKEKKQEEDVDETIRSIEISGLKSFMQAQSKPAKMFWLILLLASTGILIWQLYKTIVNYVNSPIVSTYTITTVPEMEFPIVYVCPTTLARNAYLNETPAAEAMALELKEDMGVVWDYVKFLASANLSDQFQLDKMDRSAHVIPTAFKDMARVKANEINRTSLLKENDFWNETIDIHHKPDPEIFFKNATVGLDAHVKHCEFRSFLFEELPCQNITREVFDPDYGKCYVVNVGDRKQAVQSQGLFLVFNVQSKSFPTMSPLAPLFNGVVVMIEKEYNVAGSGERFFVAPGSYNRIDLAVQRQEFQSFEHPYHQACTGGDNGNNFEYQIFNVNYTKRSCGFDCVVRAIKEKCSCLPPVDRSLYKDNVLNETSEFCMASHLSCIQQKVHKDPMVTDQMEQCRKQCNVPCVDWRYDVRVTTMDLYKPSFASFQYVPDITYLMVAYSHMEYTQFTQDYSATVDEMIANIGGEVGLWLGASMMTLIQLPLSFITVCGLCCVKRAKRTAVNVRRMSMAPNAVHNVK